MKFPKSAKDIQIGGNHYKKLGAYQPWEVLERWLTPEEFRGFMKGTAIAYLAREKDKGGDDDISKACHTLTYLVEVNGRRRLHMPEVSKTNEGKGSKKQRRRNCKA